MICLVLAIASLWKYPLSIKLSSRLGYLKLFTCYSYSNCRNWLVDWLRNFSESNLKWNHALTRNFYLKFINAVFWLKSAIYLISKCHAVVTSATICRKITILGISGQDFQIPRGWEKRWYLSVESWSRSWMKKEIIDLQGTEHSIRSFAGDTRKDIISFFYTIQNFKMKNKWLCPIPSRPIISTVLEKGSKVQFYL